MAAPVPTARQTPIGFRLKNGYQALLTFEFATLANYFEIAVGVPGLDAGDEIDITTQHNVTWRTFAPRTLVTLTPFTVTAAYEPDVFTEFYNQLGVEQTFTIKFPDTSTLAFYAFLKSVEFDPMVDGEMPMLTITIVPTNYDPDNCVEAGPVLDDNGTC